MSDAQHAPTCTVGHAACDWPECSCWCHKTELQGATEQPAEGVMLGSAGEFAAAWNALTPEQREDRWATIAAALDAQYLALMRRMRPEDVQPRLERLNLLERRDGVRRHEAELRARTEQARFWALVSRPILPEVQTVRRGDHG